MIIFRVNPTLPPMPTPPPPTDEEDDDTPPPPPPPVPDNIVDPFEQPEPESDPAPQGGGEDGEDGEPIDTDEIDKSDLDEDGDDETQDIEETDRERGRDDDDEDGEDGEDGEGGDEDGDDGLTPEQREFQKEIEEKRERITLRKRAETTIKAIDQIVGSGKATDGEIVSLEGKKKSFLDILDQIED